MTRDGVIEAYQSDGNIRSETVGTFVGEIVDEAAVAERDVGYVGDVQFAGGGDKAVCFVGGFEGGVFGFYDVDFGNWGRRKVVAVGLDMVLRSGP